MNMQAPIAARPSAKLKLNPIMGSLPVLQYCAPEQLLIDDNYQRSLETESSQTLVRRIAVSWDWGLCQPLFVARRDDGGLYVVDGQHRLAAAVLRGDIAQLPCVVSHFDSATREAAAFVALNQQRRPLTALDLFKAALAAGDAEAMKVKAALDLAGLRLANTTNNQQMRAGQVGNVGGLQRCLRVYGDQVLATSLRVLSRAWPQQVLRYAGSIFPGIVAVVAGELNNRAAPDDLVDRLAPFVGRRAQHEWYAQFQLAIADETNLSRARAAEKVLRGAWVEYSQARLGERAAPAATASDQAPATWLRPDDQAWCDQCDRKVSGARAAACADPFCKLKGTPA